MKWDDDYRVEIKSSVIAADRSVRCHPAVMGIFYILPRHDFELGRASANFSVHRVFLAFPFPRTTIPHPKIVVTPVSR